MEVGSYGVNMEDTSFRIIHVPDPPIQKSKSVTSSGSSFNSNYMVHKSFPLTPNFTIDFTDFSISIVHHLGLKFKYRRTEVADTRN